MKNSTLLILVFLLFSMNCLFVQTFAQNVKTSIDALTQQTGAVITVNKNSGIAQFVKFPHTNPIELQGNTVIDKSITFLENYKGIYNLEMVTESFIPQKAETDQYGLKRVVLTQVYHGVPVFDGKLIFHFNTNEKLTAINGNYNPVIKVNPIPSLSPSQVSFIALETIYNQNINFSGVPLSVNENTLYVFQKGITQGYRGANHLVYKIEVGNKLDVREYIFVDAHEGSIVEQYTGIAHAIDRTIYEGDTSNTVWQEGDAFPGSLDIWQQNEVVVSGHTYNFFKNAFGYVSYNGADIPMRVINNLSAPGYCPNANWNGETVNFCEGTASDDIIGHEWGHAYTEYTSGLLYLWQSGAINEAYSDIWGETIDLINGYEDEGEDLSLRTECLSSDRWMNGEDTVWSPGLRDLWDPTCNDDPGKVSDDEFRCSSGDNGGVHTNSGVINHTYVLLVDGGDYNGQTITGIGFTKAAHIFWRAQSQYLTQTSGFIPFADAIEASGADLIGVNLEGLSTDAPKGPSGEMITVNDLTQLTNVLLATELRGDIPSECYETILQPLINELCEAATSNPIFFEDWEEGFGDWTFEQLPVNPDLWIPRGWLIFNDPVEANREGNVAYGPARNYANCSTGGQEGIIRLTSPVITMPDSQYPIFEMAFNHLIYFEEGRDGANIKYSIDGGDWNLIESSSFTENTYNYSELTTSENPLSGEPGFTAMNPGAASILNWGTSVIDLATIGVVSNSTIQFRFEVGTDRCYGLVGWGLDEIMVYDCNKPLSITDNDFENSFIAYPNPTSNILNVEVASVISSVEVLNILGQSLYSETTNTNTTQIDLSAFPTGNYFVRVTVDNNTIVLQIIKQ